MAGLCQVARTNLHRLTLSRCWNLMYCCFYYRLTYFHVMYPELRQTLFVPDFFLCFHASLYILRPLQTLTKLAFKHKASLQNISAGSVLSTVHTINSTSQSIKQLELLGLIWWQNWLQLLQSLLSCAAAGGNNSEACLWASHRPNKLMFEINISITN